MNLSNTQEKRNLNMRDQSEAMRQLIAEFPAFKIAPTGSVFYNGVGHDMDFLVLIPADSLGISHRQLLDAGFLICSHGEGYVNAEPGLWEAYRRGGVNLIVIHDEGEYRRWQQARDVCKVVAALQKGGITKPVRCAIHQLLQTQDSLDSAIARGNELLQKFPNDY